jgi:hypothetical protein|tara:strand:+ start:138 stop:368 length:231 start_codon:yes stop_codon:yes gene_type:complete
MSFQEKLIANLLKPMIPKLESHMKGMELEEGEDRTSIMINIENAEILISIVAIKSENNQVVVNRVIKTFNEKQLVG